MTQKIMDSPKISEKKAMNMYMGSAPLLCWDNDFRLFSAQQLATNDGMNNGISGSILLISPHLTLKW
jgi:hypothetical protein